VKRSHRARGASRLVEKKRYGCESYAKLGGGKFLASSSVEKMLRGREKWQLIR